MNNNVKTVMLLALLGAVFVAVGQLLGGSTGALIALGFAALLNFGMYFYSDRLALAGAHAKPVSERQAPRVYRIVQMLALAQQMPMPTIYMIDSPQPNAFATGRNPNKAAVAVTKGILDLMDDVELEGVLAHELAHVRNRDILISSIAATIAVALTLLARMFMWSSLFGGNRNRDSSPFAAIGFLVSIIVAPLAAAVIRMAISRSREYQADRSGAAITNNPLGLASALSKLGTYTARVPMEVNPAVSQLFIADPLKALRGRRDQRNTLVRWFSTHPPIERRVERLEKMAMGMR